MRDGSCAAGKLRAAWSFPFREEHPCDKVPLASERFIQMSIGAQREFHMPTDKYRFSFPLFAPSMVREVARW